MRGLRRRRRWRRARRHRPGSPPGPSSPSRRRSAAVLEVTDHGPGPTGEQAERAFERFYRADQARTPAAAAWAWPSSPRWSPRTAARSGWSPRPARARPSAIALPLAPEAMHDDPDEPGDPALLTQGRPRAAAENGHDVPERRLGWPPAPAQMARTARAAASGGSV